MGQYLATIDTVARRRHQSRAGSAVAHMSQGAISGGGTYIAIIWDADLIWTNGIWYENQHVPRTVYDDKWVKHE